MFPSSLRRIAPRPALAALFCAPILLLSACGGGGAGADASAPAASSALMLDASNQKLVAAEALGSATGLGSAGAASAGTVRLASVTALLVAQAPAVLSQAPGIAVSQTVPCGLGGSLTLSGQATGGTAVVQGDSLSASLASCRLLVDGVPTTLGGVLAIRITAGSLHPLAPTFPSHIAISITATNLSVSAAGQTDTSNGDLLIDLTQASPSVSDVVLSGASVSNTVTTAGGSRSFTLSNFRQHVGVNQGATTFELVATLSSTDSRLGAGTGSFSVETPTPIVTSAAGDFVSGSLKVVGGGNSAVLLSVTAPNTFQLQLDAGGDGSYELSTAGVTVAELRSLLR
jgi:hypothetical protein